MDDTNRIKKPGYDKIALLGLFIIALLTAHLIVVFKSGISFTEPILLPQMGVSVSMPSGSGWQSEKQWQYKENMFTLSSLFPISSDKPNTWANCRYLLNAETTTPQMRFMQRASEINAVIVETNQTQIDMLTIEWALIEKPEYLFTVFYGTARLPDNRQLDIEVRHIAGQREFAERVFKGILKNLKIEINKVSLP